MKTLLAISLCVVCLASTARGQLFSDDFGTRTTLPPWVAQSGNWSVAGGVMKGGTNTALTYGFAYAGASTNNFTNFSAQAQFTFPAGAYGGGLGGRINTSSGAHYAAWVYPENSSGGSNVLKLIRFDDYGSTTPVVLQQANLAAVGTSSHTVKLEFAGSLINVYFDATKLISATDATYASGSISVDMWTYTNGYQMTLDNVVVSALPLVANNDNYTAVSGTALSVAAPGVLANDTGGNGPLSATVVTAPTYGTLTLTNNGGFTYTPPGNFGGTDTFTYRASDGQSSANGTVTITVVNPLFTDSFNRTTLPPWVAQSGNWAVSTGALVGGINTASSYGLAYVANSWTNYSVQASIQLSAGAFGGGVDACLNTTTGARYAAWIYPEGSPGGALTLKLIKFQDWTTFAYAPNGGASQPMQSVNLASVGTSPHTLKLACITNQITVSLDGVALISMADAEAQPYAGGGIGADFWTGATGYQMTVDDVVVVGASTASSVFLTENFDGVTPPALPSGWTTSATNSQFLWYTTSSPNDTAPNSIFCPDADTYNISELVSPPFTVPTGPAQLVFRSYCDLEPGSTASEGYDGGVLEIKIGAGAFTDILTAGGSFTANGYNRTLSSSYGNPLGGRQAWSGRSSSFSTVIASLPAAAVGQSVQLRWRCATDGDNSSSPTVSGWRIDSVVVKVNSAPVLPYQLDRTMLELTTLTVNNTATDSDIPADTLTYSLLAAPTGAAISASGVITWTPSQSQSPTTNTFTSRVVDNGVPPLSATNTFTVIVQESNVPPTLPVIPAQTVSVLTLMTVANTATNANIHSTISGYRLVNPPTGASISANGIITWTPTLAQSPSTNTITTVVTNTNPYDLINPRLTATNSFTVVVLSGPSVVLDSTALIAEGFLPTNNAIDPGEMVSVRFALKNVGGANTTNLVVTLLQTNGVLSPSAQQTYGVITAGGAAVSQPFTFTASGSCGGTITPTLRLMDNSTSLGTASATLTLGQPRNGILSTQNFDSVTAPALPSGWTTATSGVGVNWTTTSSTDTTPNAAYAAEVNNIGTADLLSPSINLSNATGPFQLTFRNNYDLEFDANGYYDGGVLEINIGNTAFVDITNAGGVFVSGGYNAKISSAYQSPIASRGAWTGNSSGYITTVVNLPASVAGQSIQLRWRCATDNGGPTPTGWRIDSIGLTGNGYVCGTNTAPVLPSQSNRTINELTTLSVTNTATDAESPPEVLAYSLTTAPANAVISTNGVITWTPSEAQGPGTYTFTTVVSDNANPPLSANNSFTVTVNEVNSAPTLTVPANQTIDELAVWNANATAVDTDSPPNTLTFELVSGPTGLTVSSAGAMSWTPTEVQGPGTYTVTVRVFDNGTPTLSATNTFTLTVNEVNSAPTLTVPANQTIDELVLWTATATAVDSDLPANTLTFSLVSGPTGLTVSPAGAMSWTPTEAQGPGTYTVTVRVTDNGTPNLSDTKSFTLTVNEVNSAPTLTVPANQTIDELALWTATATAVDSDLPANTLTFSLVSGPTGLTVSPAGAMSWTPTEAQGPGTYTVTVRVTDNGTPNLSDTKSFTLTVNEVNSAPTLTVPANQTIDELALWTATATAVDSDLPANTLTFSLVSGPTGLTVSPAGAMSWTPTEAQGPGTYTVTVRVTDNGTPNLSDTKSFTLTVNEVNSAPTLTVPADQTIDELALWTATATAVDSDLPANTLTFSLVSGPTGLTVSPAGVMSWTPTEAQGPGTYTVTVRVTDNGTPNLSDTKSFTLTVNEVNSAPTLTVPANQTIDELVLWTATATAVDSDLPANTLTFSLVSGPTGLTVSPAGAMSWTPTEAQGPGTYTVTVRVTDNGTPSLSDTKSFTLTVNEVNSAPTLTVPANQTINELALWTANATAVDSDSPPNTLTFDLVSGPTGLTVTSAGLISWTPTEAQGPGTYTATVRVTDNGTPSLSDSKSFTVTVNEVNSAPTLTVPANQTINELALWTANATAVDTDSPPNTLTFELVSGPTGLTVSSAGLISWTPTEAQGPGSYTVKVRVFDNGSPSLSDTNSFTLTVNEVNSAPTLTLPANQTVNQLALWTANATAADTDSPPNTLTFELVSGPAGLTVSPAGLISWTPPGVQELSPNTVTVRVFDNGVPSLSDTNSFIVTVAPPTNTTPPVIQSVNVSNGVVTITWSAVTGSKYRLQCQDGALSTNWYDEALDVQASGSTATCTNTPGTVRQRFYRVHLMP